MHKLKIVHNDIKLENIIIDKNDNALLIDITGKNGTLSSYTEGYLPPEMF